MFIFYLSPKTARFSFGLLISLFLVSIFLAFLGEGIGDDFGADSVLLWIWSHDPFLIFCESIIGDFKLANLSITVSRLPFTSLLPHNNCSFDIIGGGEFSSSTIKRNKKIMKNGYSWNFLHLRLVYQHKIWMLLLTFIFFFNAILNIVSWFAPPPCWCIHFQSFSSTIFCLRPILHFPEMWWDHF